MAAALVQWMSLPLHIYQCLLLQPQIVFDEINGLFCAFAEKSFILRSFNSSTVFLLLLLLLLTYSDVNLYTSCILFHTFTLVSQYFINVLVSSYVVLLSVCVQNLFVYTASIRCQGICCLIPRFVNMMVSIVLSLLQTLWISFSLFFSFFFSHEDLK
jgi:hypothetical protein